MNDHKQALQKEIEELKKELLLVQKAVDQEKAITKRASIMLFSNDYDKLMMAINMAISAAALGMEVTIFFSFWAVSALKKKTIYQNKTWGYKIMSFMLPSNIDHSKLSKFYYFGLGQWMFKKIMKKNNMQSLSELIETAKNMGIKLYACSPTLKLLGIKKGELIDGLSFCGSTPFLVNASHSGITWIV